MSKQNQELNNNINSGLISVMQRSLGDNKIDYPVVLYGSFDNKIDYPIALLDNSNNAENSNPLIIIANAQPSLHNYFSSSSAYHFREASTALSNIYNDTTEASKSLYDHFSSLSGIFDTVTEVAYYAVTRPEAIAHMHTSLATAEFLYGASMPFLPSTITGSLLSLSMTNPLAFFSIVTLGPLILKHHQGLLETAKYSLNTVENITKMMFHLAASGQYKALSAALQSIEHVPGEKLLALTTNSQASIENKGKEEAVNKPLSIEDFSNMENNSDDKGKEKEEDYQELKLDDFTDLGSIQEEIIGDVLPSEPIGDFEFI